MLEILRRIVQEVNAAPDLEQALKIIVARVCKAVSVDVSSVYLVDADRQQFVLGATQGLRQDAVGRVKMRFDQGLIGMVYEREEPVNSQDAPSHPRYVVVRETGEAPYHGFLGVPIIRNGNVLGVLVIQQREARKFGEDEEAFLVTLAAQLAGAITHAGATGDISSVLGANATEAAALTGLPGSPGVAIGRAKVV